MSRVAEYRKAIAALVLAVATWAGTALADSDGITDVEWVGLVGVLATALGVERIANAPARPAEVEKDAGMTAVEALVVGLILILLAAFVFGYAGR